MNPLRRLFRSQEPLPPAATDRPLLDQEEVRRLYLAATTSADAGQREIAHVRAGEQRGLRRGSGLDYDDSRPYQAGDDPRYINWRLSARSGDLHMKLFREERRPSCCILLDRRASMAFGTRTRLKVTQAARVAAFAAFAAVHRGEEVAALVLQSRLHWIDARPGEQAAFSLVQQFAAPRPPVFAPGPRRPRAEPGLEQALALLLERLPAGTQVVLVSDFLDLQGGTGSPVAARLRALCTAHRVRAAHIADPAEQELPRAGPLPLLSIAAAAGGGAAAAPRWVDCADPDLRRAYSRAAARHFSRRAELLRVAGADYRLLTTPDPAPETWF